jgi:long-subunit acyl-CoA synthetase (AMP-forming)
MTAVHPVKQFLNRVEANPTGLYLHQPKAGQWTSYTWAEVDNQARKIAAGLRDQGYAPGDRVAILAKNSAEWIVADLAIAMAGLISVPIYYTAGESTIAYVLEHSASKAIFVGKLDDYGPLISANPGLPTIGFPYDGVQAEIQWNDWLNTFAPLEDICVPELDDVYTLVYTSGSTGNPKGVVLTGRNLESAASALSVMYSDTTDRMLSYLPMAHITERSLVTMASLYYDIQVFFNESMETFVRDLQHAKVTVFLSVPRLWAKFQAQILSKVPDQRLQRILSLPIVGKLFAKRIRQQLGFECCHAFGSGTAPIPPSLLIWWQRLGVCIGEGWGMTELSGAATGNTPFEASRLGSIGEPFDGLELKLSDSGELMVRGESVFNEYYNNPEATASSFEDGWFKTGDKAIKNSDGSWRITGRVKEQFKTAKGKYVAPVPIESLVEANIYIEQSCVVGSGLPQPVALVVVSSQHGQPQNEVEKSLLATLASVNGAVESHERLDRLIVVKAPWTIENGLLTPTMKLKRSDIEAAHNDLVEASSQGKLVWE